MTTRRKTLKSFRERQQYNHNLRHYGEPYNSTVVEPVNEDSTDLVNEPSGSVYLVETSNKYQNIPNPDYS